MINTGGWYKLCCPTSQLWKPDILGAIYRIRRTEAPRVDDPRGLKLAWHEASAQTLCDLLGDARPAVRKRAIQELAAQGGRVVPVAPRTLKSPTAEARRNAVWTLTRIEGPKARQAVRAALTIRTKRSVKRPFIPLASGAMQMRHPRSSRCCGPASLKTSGLRPRLGPHRRQSRHPRLLEASGRLETDPARHDRILEHSLTYALIEIDDPAATRAGLQSDRPWTRRSADRTRPDGRRRPAADKDRRSFGRPRSGFEGGRVVDSGSPCRMGQCPFLFTPRTALGTANFQA